jgi:GDP-4-dehydro-6-deoxy-D-mannose reductase
MNVLVTGIDGFVGNHLMNALAANPVYKIFGTIHKPTSPPVPYQPLLPSVAVIDTDISDIQSVKSALSQARPEKVYHLAGQAFVPRSIEDPLTTYRTNIDGTLNILEALRLYTKASGTKCSMLVVCSGEVYGEITPELLPVNEETPLRPANPYAVSKACADMLARQYRSTYGLDIVVARPFNHLGPGQSELFVGSAFAKQVVEIKLGLREPKMSVGNLDPRRDFTDVRDVVRAYLQMLDRPMNFPVYNISQGSSISVKELLNIMIEFSGIHPEIMQDPSRMRKKEIPEIVGDSSRLFRETGWKPLIPIRQTLSDLLSYWENRLQSRK